MGDLDYALDFELHSARLNQLDLNPRIWYIVPGTCRVRVTTRVLAGWLLHIALHPERVRDRDNLMVRCMVDSAHVDDLDAIGHIVRATTFDWLDCSVCQAVLQYLASVPP